MSSEMKLVQPTRKPVDALPIRRIEDREHRGLRCSLSMYSPDARFGRMFRGLPIMRTDPGKLRELAAIDGVLDGRDSGPDPRNPDHPDALPAGFAFLGRFIEHELTLDCASEHEKQVDAEALHHFRPARLALDGVYGSGPDGAEYLYERLDRARFLLGSDTEGNGGRDIVRNSEGIGILADPRNDANLILSQMHLAFQRFHNACLDRIRGRGAQGSKDERLTFEHAQREVRRHFQWIVLHEYLVYLVGKPMVDAVLRTRRFYQVRAVPSLPVEFLLGPSASLCTLMRPTYRINEALWGDLHGVLAGGRQVTTERRVDWRQFFFIDTNSTPLLSKRIDTKLTTELLTPMPGGSADDRGSVAECFLLRSAEVGLPSGQSIAEAMRAGHGIDSERIPGLRPIVALGKGDFPELREFGLDEQTPLWYYILKEAELQTGGGMLGPVGGRIFAEVIIGLLQADPLSFVRSAPRWRPDGADQGGFGMGDLLRVAGAV